MAGEGPGWVLAVDFGTTATAAVIGVNGQLTALALDGAGRMPSSVYAEDTTGVLVVGQSADHAAGYALHRYEPTPKRRVGQSTVLLGGAEYTPAQLIGAVLARVLREAIIHYDGHPPTQLVLTHPVRWRRSRRTILADAARHGAQQVGLGGVPEPVFVPEPVAAAQWFAATGPEAPTEGDCFGVYDLGGGTFDAAVLQKTRDGFTVLQSGGIDPLGGVDFDHRLFTYLGERYINAADRGLWNALRSADPEDPDLSERRLRLQTRVRLLREDLSTNPARQCHLPGVSTPVLINRGEYENLIRADVEDTVDELEETITRAGLTPADLTAIYRIGGATATPLIGITLDRLHQPVRTSHDPKTIVAQGAATTPAVPPVHPDTMSVAQTSDQQAHANPRATDPLSIPVAGSQTPDIHNADGRSLDQPQKAIDLDAQRAATDASTLGQRNNPPDTKTGAHPHAPKNPVEFGETDLVDPLPRPMGKTAWGCVLTGTVFIAAAMFYILVPLGGDRDERVPSAVLAVIGALLIGAALRTRTRAARGIVLIGVVLITVAAVMLVAVHLRTGPMAMVGCVGVLLVAAGWLGSRSRRQTRETQSAKPTPGRRWWRRKSFAAIFLAACVAGGVLGFMLWPSPPSPRPTPGFNPTWPSSSSAPTTWPWSSSAPSAGPVGLQKLLTLLPPGYANSACTPSTPKPNEAVAVSCGANHDQGGPSAAVYALFTNPDAMNAEYQGQLAYNGAAACADGTPSPHTFRDQSSGQTGTMFCGTLRTNHIPLIVWTNDTSLVLASALGPNAAALYQWWLTHA